MANTYFTIIQKPLDGHRVSAQFYDRENDIAIAVGTRKKARVVVRTETDQNNREHFVFAIIVAEADGPYRKATATTNYFKAIGLAATLAE